jgi:hypothetical protein
LLAEKTTETLKKKIVFLRCSINITAHAALISIH